MKRFSTDKDINNLVRDLLSSGWGYQNRKKHTIILSPKGKRIAVPSTPSDRRAYANFRRDINHIIQG